MHPWSSRPRTYIILHNLAHPQLMDEFVREDKTDIWLPYDEETLPTFIQPCSLREKFLEIQRYVLTSARELEDISTDVYSKVLPHINLEGNGDEHFKKINTLGTGSYGNNGPAQKYLAKELTDLKQLSHRHLVKILGSYTDTECIAFLMLPVAECNLESFLKKHGGLSEGDRHDLRTFFGCLAGAVDYLHRSKIRHRDLSSRNVLVHQGSVVVSDFGSAYKWAGNGSQGSVTQSHHVPASTFYMAPEVSRKAPRSSPSDLWSLGVIFMEMATVLARRPVADLQSLLNERGRATDQPYLWADPKAVTIWLETLQKSNGDSHHDNEPLEWIRNLLNPKPKRRPTSDVLMHDIHDAQSFNIFCCIHCQPVFRDRRFRDVGMLFTETQAIREVVYEDGTEIMQSVASILQEKTTQPVVISADRQQSMYTWLNDVVLPPPRLSPMPGAFGAAEEDNDEYSNQDLPQSSVASMVHLRKDTCRLSPVELLQTIGEVEATSCYPSNLADDLFLDGAPEFAKDTGLGFYEIDSPSSNEDCYRVLSDSSGSDSSSDISTVLPLHGNSAEAALPAWRLPQFTGPENKLIEALDSLSDGQDEWEDALEVPIDSEANCNIPNSEDQDPSTARGISGIDLDTASNPRGDPATEENSTAVVEGLMSLETNERPVVAHIRDVVLNTADRDKELVPKTTVNATSSTEGGTTEHPVPEPCNAVDTKPLLIDTAVEDIALAEHPDRMDKETSVNAPEAKEVARSSNEDAITRPNKNSSRKRSAQSPRSTCSMEDANILPSDQLLQSEHGRAVSPTKYTAEPFKNSRPDEQSTIESFNVKKKGYMQAKLHHEQQKKRSNAQPKPNKDTATAPTQSASCERVSGPLNQEKENFIRELKAWRKQLPNPQASAPKNPATSSVASKAPLEVSSLPYPVLLNTPKSTIDSKKQQKKIKTPQVVLSAESRNSLLRPISQKQEPTSLAQSPSGVPEFQQACRSLSNKPSAPRVTFTDNTLSNLESPIEDKRALRPGVSASDFIQNTWDAASSVATSAMSAETKRLLKGVSLNQWLDRDHKLLETFCHKGKSQAVRLLLAKGCNPGKAGSKAQRRQGPIVLSVQGASQRHNKCVRALIYAGVDVNVVNRSSGKTPLHLAIENPVFKGYEHLICALIEAGADTNKADVRGDYPIMKVLQGNRIGPLEDHRIKALALLLRENSTNVEVTVPGTLNTPLHLAVRCKDAFAVGMLLYKKANVNAKNAAGSTPLLIAAHQFHKLMTKDQMDTLNVLLRAQGILVNVKAGVKEQTALHCAVQAGVLWAIERLLKHGADPTCRDSKGRDSLALARDCAKEGVLDDPDTIMRQLEDASVARKPCNKRNSSSLRDLKLLQNRQL
ncbi:dual specificity mitogen-activated protein kinase kinase 1 [Stagonosporopsis vannaccii]|nr:dual specificity mitogen-activated protein kinase kinase 1 [Stagonosporopsis vannaccii]